MTHLSAQLSRLLVHLIEVFSYLKPDRGVWCYTRPPIYQGQIGHHLEARSDATRCIAPSSSGRTAIHRHFNNVWLY